MPGVQNHGNRIATSRSSDDGFVVFGDFIQLAQQPLQYLGALLVEVPRFARITREIE